MEIRLASARPGTAGNAALVALLEAHDPDTLFLILAPRLDRDAQGADWVRAVEAHGAWVQIWPVDPQRLVAWLKGRCRRLKLEASDEALELLAARTEGNLLAAHQELTKLTLLAPGGRVTADAVLASVADSARFDVFRLGEAVLAGETARALRVLAGLRAEGTEPTLALWALSRALRDVWSARGGGTPPAWQQRHRAALAQALRRASRLPFAALAVRAARADRMIKGRVGAMRGTSWRCWRLTCAGSLPGQALGSRACRRCNRCNPSASSAAPSTRFTVAICAPRSSCGRSCGWRKCASCPPAARRIAPSCTRAPSGGYRWCGRRWRISRASWSTTAKYAAAACRIRWTR